mgnify:CR=1 FL=1
MMRIPLGDRKVTSPVYGRSQRGHLRGVLSSPPSHKERTSLESRVYNVGYHNHT